MAKDKRELTEQELRTKAQQILQDKIRKANIEVAKVLQKYGLDLRVNQTIVFVPRQQR